MNEASWAAAAVVLLGLLLFGAHILSIRVNAG